MGTNKKRTKTRTKLSTVGTELGSVHGIDFNDFDSFSFSFILNKALQLEETPIANPIIHSSTSSGISYSLKIFQDDFAPIKNVYDFLTDVMVNPTHKPLLFSRQLLKKPSRTSSAFTLELTSQESEFPFCLFDFGRMKEFIIGSNGKIVNSQVHTENSVRTRTHGAFLGECEQEETFTFGINPQKTFIDFPVEIIFETIGDSERNFNSSIDSEDAQDIILEGETSGEVISHGTEFDNGLSFGYFYHPASLSNTCHRKISWKSYHSQFLIDQRVKFKTIFNIYSPSLINTQLQSFLINFDSLDKFGPSLNLNFSCCSGSHKLSNNLSFKYLTMEILK